MRFIRSILTVVFLLGYQVRAEQQLFCPNNGIPKSDIKCLPDKENVCGEGFACFYSGVDYHCCPTGDKSADDEFKGECPDYTVALLDSNGKPIKCSSLGNQCSQKNAYCNENSKEPICCQNLKPNSEEIKKQEEIEAIENFFNEDKSSANKEVENLECPKNSLIVLGEDGEPISCTASSECPQTGMFCHGDTKKTCCESIENVGPTTKEPNSLNIRPDSTESVKTDQTTQSTSTTTKEAKIDLSTLITTIAPIKSNKTSKIGISEATHKNDEKLSNRPAKQGNPKAFASKTSHFDDNGKPVYKPHAAGGYAVSKPLDKATTPSHTDKKEIVQQYLLEQIKQGWPYDEKFFRPGNTAVIRTNGQPTTVVHFQ